MDKSLTELCAELNNYFPVKKKVGSFVVADGVISNVESLGLQNGQYYRVRGSVFNDGVHKYPNDVLINENSFNGAVWSMAVPSAVIDLATEVAAWQEKYGGVDSASMSPYNSESFGGYSYSKSAGGSSSNSAETANSWQAAFASRLNKWRRLRGLE